MSWLKIFKDAGRGVMMAFREERNVRIHIAACIVVTGAGFYFDLSLTEWCLILICFGMVIGFELINSAVENLTDLVTRERHPIAGKVKDIAAGAVLVSAIVSAAIGIIIFAKHIF